MKSPKVLKYLPPSVIQSALGIINRQQWEEYICSDSEMIRKRWGDKEKGDNNHQVDETLPGVARSCGQNSQQ